MSWHPCEAEDCENGADEEGGLCGIHTKLHLVTMALERAKEIIKSDLYYESDAIKEIERIVSGEEAK